MPRAFEFRCNAFIVFALRCEVSGALDLTADRWSIPIVKSENKLDESIRIAVSPAPQVSSAFRTNIVAPISARSGNRESEAFIAIKLGSWVFSIFVFDENLSGSGNEIAVLDGDFCLRHGPAPM